MKMKKLIQVIFMTLVLVAVADAQNTGKPLPVPGSHPRPQQIQKPVKPGAAIPPAESNIFQSQNRGFQTLPPLHKRVKNQPGMTVELSENGMPLLIKGIPASYAAGKDIETQCNEYLVAIKDQIRIKEPSNEFQIKSISKDEQHNFHIRLLQNHQGVKIYGSEIVLHSHNGIIDMFNGRNFPSPENIVVTPAITKEAAQLLLQTDLASRVNFRTIPAEQLWLIGNEQFQTELVIYFDGKDQNEPVLAWHSTVYPNIMSRWEYFVDALTGRILHQYESLCNAADHHQPDKLVDNECPPGPTTANIQDLTGVTRTLNVYQQGSTYYLIDASRSMFNNAQSSIPNSPVGSIITLNAQNTSPANNSFNYVNMQDGDNNWGTTLDVKKAASAHYNAGQAYTYFKNSFNRESINGQGGNIISLVNVADEGGGGMDNAFWNGQAMFYGNGDQAFSPLSEALDVGGHEMSHGVIEKTANLEYQGESGAMNESFADIFGAMIDRDDWKMGEDITSTQFFPTGALRDLSNPHNGGNNLNDNGWQPNHVSEKYTGTQDNGGVHINSGITNYAYYLFANNGNVGKEKAEQVFYKALRDYLVMSSKFIDLRASVLSAIDDLNYNQAVTDAANNAFIQVGIGGGGSSGGAVYQQNLPVNPGNEYLLYTDVNGSGLWISETDGSNEVQISDTPIRSKPSITDNGAEIVFIGADNKMYYITIDSWNPIQATELVLQSEPIWRNAVFSKDGWKLAATFDDLSDEIWIYSFANLTDQTFQLYNPTTAENIETGEVQYADAMEWDHAGEYVMYDAINLLNNSNGADISYWDIGFLRAWKNSINNFGDGNIDKLFSSLPENTSIGDPAFSKNSPYIVAFDFIDNYNNTYAIYGANLETGNTGLIFENNQLGYPNYSNTDNKVIFNAEDTNGDAIIGAQGLQSNKIQPSGSAVGLIYGFWATWFANGNRNLAISTDQINALDGQLNAFPNPFDETMVVEIASPGSSKAQLYLYDLLGKEIYRKDWEVIQGNNYLEMNTADLPAGTYFLHILLGDKSAIKKLVK